MSIKIVIAIIVLLCALACYSFISQTIEKKRIQKQRLLMALKTKYRNSIHLMSGFPPQFLTNDLMSLIYRNLLETCTQLSRIEPQETQHHENITLYSRQLETLSTATSTVKVSINDPQQMKEIRQHLLELQQFLLQQTHLKIINKTQADAYAEQIKRLALHISVEENVYQAKQAKQNGKHRLAIHYFTLAKKLFMAENRTHSFDSQINQLDAVINKLEEQDLATQANPVENETTKKDVTNKEWDSFSKEDKEEKENWKKKQVYD
jgi:hypothetical protein